MENIGTSACTQFDCHFRANLKGIEHTFKMKYYLEMKHRHDRCESWWLKHTRMTWKIEKKGQKMCQNYF